ncbi:MAG: c-type cytochrome [Acidobacteria bacterium]|nr:c-type cytochrome [Acidobacteriota bacterium]
MISIRTSSLTILAILWSQAPLPAQAPALADGRTLYAEHCAACHGADARGTARGRELAGSRRLRGRSLRELSELIRNGVPSAGMPAFDLPAARLDGRSDRPSNLGVCAPAHSGPGGRRRAGH